MMEGENKRGVKISGQVDSDFIFKLGSVWRGDKTRRGDLCIDAAAFREGDKMAVSVIMKQIQTFWIRNYITLKCYLDLQ
jgi:hypothetical protein